MLNAMVSRLKGLFGIAGLAVLRQPYNVAKCISYVPPIYNLRGLNMKKYIVTLYPLQI